MTFAKVESVVYRSLFCNYRRREIIKVNAASNNPWINHVKAFAKKHNMSYWEALKSGKAKQSYVKGGTNIFNPIDGFKVGYKFGHDTLGPALFGKK